MKSGAEEAVPERNMVFEGETCDLAAGGRAAPRRAPGDDAPHGVIARRSSAFRTRRPDRCLTPVDYFRHRPPADALPKASHQPSLAHITN
jgi:hypothetical protein